MINRDDAGKIEVPMEFLALARQMNQQVVIVICIDPDPEVGDVSFVCMTPFLPSEGDRIVLEDGTKCEVHHTNFVLRRSEDEIVILGLVPNVFASKVSDE